MKLYGIGILPDRQNTKKIIKFQNENISFFRSPKLSINGFLPHVSILQCPFYKKSLNQKLIDDVYELWSNIKFKDKRLTFGEIYYQPNGWYFLKVKKEEWMTVFQREVLQLMKPLIDYKQIETNSGFPLYSKDERENFLKYGYRYIGKSFRPHITLGRNKNNLEINYQIYNQGLNLFNKKNFKYSKIVIYEAGIDGALAKIIAERTLF